MFKNVFLQRLVARIRRFLLWFFVLTFLWVLVYRWVNPPFTLLMLQRYIEAMIGNEENPVITYRWTSYHHISPNMAIAVIAAEDQDFPTHYGFDIEAIRHAIRYNQTHERTRGGSTISQQVAKNVFLWQNRDWLRKGLEVYFTLLIELLWSKERIMEMYLNMIEMGDRVFGIAAAANHYYKVKPEKLTLEQSAAIAVCLPNPIRYNPTKPTTFLVKRKNWTLRQVQRLGGLRYLKNMYQ